MSRLKLSPNTVLIQVLQQRLTLFSRPVTKLLGEGSANIQTALTILVMCADNRLSAHMTRMVSAVCMFAEPSPRSFVTGLEKRVRRCWSTCINTVFGLSFKRDISGVLVIW